MLELPDELLDGGIALIRRDDGGVTVIQSTRLSAAEARAQGVDLLAMSGEVEEATS